MSRSSKPAPSKEPGPVDVTLAATLVGLIAFGVVMVYSASAVYANNMFGNGYHFLIRQTVFALLALLLLFVFAHINIDLLRRTTYPVLLVAVVLMIGLLTFVVLFAAGAKAGYLLGCLLIAIPIGYAAIASSPYRMRRIQAFLEPFEHRRGAGYQITESLMSFGSGGWTGVGLGDGRQKLLFLPEAHTDFISAIIGEELGFIGVTLLSTAFAWIVFRGLRAAWRAQDEYAGYLAAGMTLFIGLQAFTNLAVAMGLLPTKGLALPFVSYGGSSLLVNAAAAGIILNTSRLGSWRPEQPAERMKSARRQPKLRAARGGTR